jgi:hypothetical protein
MKKQKLFYVCKIIAVVCISLNVSVVSASALKGVKEVQLVVEDLGENERKCGITSDSIDASIRINISNSKLIVRERQLLPYLYANISAQEIRDLCAISISLRFKKLAVSEKDVGTFWERGGMLTWNKAEAGSKVANIMEGFTKEFIGAWLKANAN